MYYILERAQMNELMKMVKINLINSTPFNFYCYQEITSRNINYLTPVPSHN